MRKKTRLSLAEKAGQASVLGSLLDQDIRLEFQGNREVILEGCTGILEYTDEMVRINSPKYVLRFRGRDLQVRAMTQDSIILCGYIQELSFMS